ncbi:MAG TPA: APC family permease [Candidatus Dormibacteraeota bacterium]|nr:APC family permease [Candidatus Dormibacteraeota bacterium]
MLSKNAEGAAPPTLRRAVTPWGSYSWGYADVGADIYTALGLVVGAAAGAANVAFAFAGLVYVLVGLAYTELASAFPVAGGGQFFVLRGLGDIWGFIAGWAVLLDFTIDIALFAWTMIGYLSALVPAIASTHPIPHFIVVLVVIVGLTLLNALGVRESSRLNEAIGALDIVNELAILCLAALFTFNPGVLIHTMQTHWPNSYQLLDGVSLAIISFVGIESISQAAQETERPASIIPRTSIALILTILIFALSYSNIVLGMQPWHPDQLVSPQGHHLLLFQWLGLPENQDHAVALMAGQIPYFGALAALYVPLVGAVLMLISSNSGVFGASRIAYSMATYRLLPSAFASVEKRFRTPIVSILVFSGIAIVELIFAAIQRDQGLAFLGDLYAFGAATSYSLVFIALIFLRYKDPYSPRAYRMPLGIPIVTKGRRWHFPVLAVVGFAGTFSILVFAFMTHPIGRIAGPLWIVVGIVFYAFYRRAHGQPIFRSRRHDWVRDQVVVLREAGELEMMDKYVAEVQAIGLLDKDVSVTTLEREK